LKKKKVRFLDYIAGKPFLMPDLLYIVLGLALLDFGWGEIGF